MTHIQIQSQTIIFNVIYNKIVKRIYVYGFSNLTNIEIYPCELYSSYNRLDCTIKNKYRSRNFFLYEIFYNYNYYPKVLIIKNKTIYIQNIYHNNNENIVCITKMINYTASNYLIQLFESYRYFGVTKFILYYTSSSSAVLRILKYYQKQQLLTLVKWNYSYEISVMKKYVYGQKWKYNDCYYRYAGNKGLLIFTDLDEIIWPIKHLSIRSILNSYDKLRSDIYIFNTKIFLKEYTSISYDRYIHIVNDFNIFQLHNSCTYPKGFLRKFIINNNSYIKILNIHDVELSLISMKLSHIPTHYGFIRHSRRVRVDL